MVDAATPRRRSDEWDQVCPMMGVENIMQLGACLGIQFSVLTQEIASVSIFFRPASKYYCQLGLDERHPYSQ